MKRERIDEKTPNGGDYSELYYLDDNGNVVDEKDATRCVIRECTNDGELIKETFAVIR